VIQIVGIFFGYLFCLYSIAFRWGAIRAKYGRLDLIFWVGYVVFLWALVGWLADIAVWAVQYSIWIIRYGAAN
jgi:hypothetical protein